MKKILILLALLILPSVCMADTVSSGLINLLDNNWSGLNPNEGVWYTVREKQLKELTALDLATYQSTKYSRLHLSLQGGYAPSSALEIGPSYDFGNLSQFNIKVPILSSFDLKVGYGYGRVWGDSKKWDGGPIVFGQYKF